MSHDERIRRLEEQILQPKPWYKRAWGTFEVMGAIIGFPSSFLSLAILFWPQVNINLDKTLNQTDPFATQFAIVNGSHFSIRQVRFVCVILGNNRTEPEVPVEEVSAGDTLVRGCGVAAPHFPLNTTLATTVIYSYPLLGTRQLTVHFESRKDAQGVPQLFKTVEVPSRLSTQ